MPPKPEHSKFSPSGAKKWMSCHLSLALEETLPPESGPKPAADYGSLCHLISEEYLDKGTKCHTRLGEIHFGQVVDDEAVEVARVYTEYCESLVNQYLFSHSYDVEGKVDLHTHGLPEVYGTADFTLTSGPDSVAYVVDLKAGSGVMVYPDNPQLKIYALGALGKYVWDYEVINLVIVQPRAKSGDKVRVHSTTPKELMKFLTDELMPAVTAINDGSTISAPSASNCQWCRAKGICKPFQEAAQLEAQDVFSPVSDKKSIGTAVDQMSNDDILDSFEKLPLLSMFVKAVEARAYEITESNQTDRYKLVKGRNKRTWISELQMKEFCNQNGLDSTEPGKLLSPAKLEKLLGKGKSKLKDLIQNESGKPIIAKADDKREAVNNLKEIFS